MTENERVANESAPTDRSAVSNSEPQKATEEILVYLGFPKVILWDNPRLWQVAGFSDTTCRDLEITFHNHLYTLAKLYEKYTGKTATVQHRENEWGVNNVYLNRKLVFCLDISCDGYDRKKHVDIYWAYKRQYLNEVKTMLQELLNATPLDKLVREFDTVYWRENAKIHLVDREIFDRDYIKYSTPYTLMSSEEKAKYEEEKRKFIEALVNDTEFAEKEVFFIIKTDFFGEEYLAEQEGIRLRVILNRSVDSVRIYQNLLVFGSSWSSEAVEINENEKQKILEIVNSTEYMKWLPNTGYWGKILGWGKDDYIKAKPKQ